MKSFHEELNIAMIGLFLSLGISMNAFASTEVQKTTDEIKTTIETSQRTVAEPVATPIAPPPSQPVEMSDDNGNQQPPISKQELNSFSQEMKNVADEANRVVKDLKGAAASNTVNEWRATLADIMSKANDCTKRAKSAPSDEKRDIIDECRQANFFRDVDDIRQQFVPPKEIKNALNEIKNQEKDLLRFVKQLAKTPGALLDKIKKLQSNLGTYRSNIVSSAGQEQREAMQEWWDARFYEEVNNVRAYAEIPKQLSGALKDLSRAESKSAKDSFKKAAAFLSIDLNAFNAAIAEKRKAFDSINAALASGDGESANELIQENLYQSWHPGELLGIIDMSSNVYRVTKLVKDADLKEQINEMLDPVISAVNEGEYREGREALDQFQRVMQQYENYLRQPRNSKLNSKMYKAFDAFEQTIQKKFNRDEGNSGRDMPQPPEEEEE